MLVFTRGGRITRRSWMWAAAGLLSLYIATPSTGGAWAQSPIADRPEKIDLITRQPESRGQGRVALSPDPEGWKRLFKAGSARIPGFPLPGGERVELEVAAVDVASFDGTIPETRLLVRGAGGLREVAGPPMRFFRGRVVGDPGSLVSLNLFGGRIAGFVRHGGREYTFGPRDFSPDRAGAPDIEMVEDALADEPTGRCDGEEPAGSAERNGAGMAGGGTGLESFASEAIDNGTLLLGKIAVEGTVEWVAKHGGVAAATTYTLNLVAQVSAVYESDIKVQLRVPYILMNAVESDGYSGASNSTSTLLTEERTKWNGTSSLRSVSRTAMHLFGTYPSGGAGRAYINVLCGNVPPSSSSYDYGVSLLEGNGGSWERRLVAHEIGHNFSSPHSHCYVPEIDRCNNTETGCYSGTVVQTTGTVMSYCNVRLTAFHARERDEKIRPGAQAAYPRCMEVAGMPGDVGGLAVGGAGTCPAANLTADDGTGNGRYGYTGTARAAWIKRFTPSCHPFKLTAVDVLIGSATTVAPGRAIRILVYADPTGSGNPANASLASSQDATVQVVNTAVWNQYTLATPVVITTGDLYLGFFDLVDDTGTTHIMEYDASRTGDSWWQADSTDPTTYTPFTSAPGTWLIRGHGGGVNPGSVVLSWNPPCNNAAVPDQDFAVYQGTIGNWAGLTSVTCTTSHAMSWLVESPPPNSFWVVVPETSANEGSYGRSSAGERAPALSACRPQAIGVCQ